MTPVGSDAVRQTPQKSRNARVRFRSPSTQTAATYGAAVGFRPSVSQQMTEIPIA
jgi:hypothetical protein